MIERPVKRVRLAALPLFLGLFGAISGLTVPLLPSPREVWPIVVHFLVFAASVGMGVSILWPQRKGRPPIALMVVGILMLRFTAALIAPGTIGLFLAVAGSHSRSLLSAYVAVIGTIGDIAVLCGASLAEPKLRSPSYVLIMAAAGLFVSISSTIFPAPASFRFLYVVVTDGVLGLILGFFLVRIAFSKMKIGHALPETVSISQEMNVICHSLFAEEQGYTIEVFLSAIASCFFVIALEVVTVGSARLVPTGQFGGGATLLLLPPVCFVWCWAFVRMWRPIIFIGSWLTGLVILAVPLVEAARIEQPTTADTLILRAIVLVLSVGAYWFGMRIVIDGWRLASASEDVTTRLRSGPPRLAGAWQALAAAFAVPSICAWLPAMWRRSLARSLFFLSGLARSYTTLGLIVIPVLIGSVIGVLPGLLLIFIVGGIGGAITGLFRNVARRFTLVSVENLSRSDTRPPVLFLRSFQDDQVQLSWESRGRFRNLMAVGEPSPTLDHVLLDEGTPLGPVFAIGVPGRPPPFGAARTYADDREWQGAVAKLAERAKAIVIVVDETPGVKWELDFIRDKGHSAKTLYLLPPRSATWTISSDILRREVFDAEAASGVVGASWLTSPGSETPTKKATRNTVCIGWYSRSNGMIAVLTAAAPTKASYVCAIRMFREQQAGRQ